MSRLQYVVTGLEVETGDDFEYSGCGWTDVGHGKRFSLHDANMVAFDVNCEGRWIGCAEKVKSHSWPI